MAEAMIKGMASHGMKEIFVSDPHEERRQYLQESFGIKTTAANTDVAAECNIIILAVKPQIMEEVLNQIADRITEDKTVVSIAAGITLSLLQSKLHTKRLIRVMPNTPALVQTGMTVMSLCECFSDSDMSTVREIFMSIGEVITLPEKYMDAVTAVSGSGPGFIAFFIEAVIEAGVKLGLSDADASTLAVQTAIGTAKLLDTGMPPAKLRAMVTSPGGTTAAGLQSFEEDGLKDTVSRALNAARDRAAELGKREVS